MKLEGNFILAISAQARGEAAENSNFTRSFVPMGQKIRLVGVGLKFELPVQ